METFIQDLIYGIRLLRRKPGVSLVIVLSIALGVSANTAVFSWIESIVQNPLPMVPHSDQLVTLTTQLKSGEYLTSSYSDFVDIREGSQTLDGLTAFEERPLSFEKHAETQRAWAMLVTANFFDVLGIRPARGRFFPPAHSSRETAAEPLVVISHDFWTSRLSRDPSIIGKTLVLNHQALTVIGVAPAGFRGTIMGLSFDVWVPLQLKDKLTGGGPEWMTIRKWRSLHAMARLKPGVSIGTAQAELNLISSRLAQLHPADNAGMKAALFRLAEAPYGAQYMLAKLLKVLFWTSFVVLLIVCSNLANILLVRAAEREKEISVRVALGAGKGRILRQLATEALVLSCIAAGLSIVLAFRLSDWIKFFIPASNVPVSLVVTLNPKVLAFAVVLSLAAGLASGLLPALRCASVKLSVALTDASRGSTGGRGKQRLRSALAMCEVSLALVALAGAGLFLKSFHNIARVNPGFDDDHVLLMGMMPSGPGHTTAELTQNYDLLRQRIQSLAGVRSVTYAEHVPLGLQEGSWEEIKVEGYNPRPDENMNIYRNLIAENYFFAMRIPLLEGRDFRSQDDGEATKVAIVNQTFARRFFNHGNVIGRHITGWGESITIIGVAKDSKYASPTEASRPYLYVPFRQFAMPETEMVLHIAAREAPANVIEAARREIGSAGSVAYVSFVMPLKEYIGAAVFKHKVASGLMSILSLTALILAGLGIYGVISHSVTQRTREIGIRIAVGASEEGILKLIVFQGVRMTAAGLLVGTLIAVALCQLLASFLYGVDPADPGTLASAALILLTVSIAASGLPALRAARMSPVKALRL
jgi:putative ABC transport system permease protein